MKPHKPSSGTRWWTIVVITLALLLCMWVWWYYHLQVAQLQPALVQP